MSQSSTRDNAGRTTLPEPSVLSSSQHVFLFLLAFRIVNALSLRTFFQPDEYYQSLEPAWQLAFGPDSGAWLTWEWRNRLRSSLHPLLFAGIYHIVSTGSGICSASVVTRAAMLLAAPRVAQAMFAACLDFFTWKLAQKFHGSDSEIPMITLGLTVFNPWNWFCSTRTLSNCVETTLTAAALYYWPWQWTARSGISKDAIGSRSGTMNAEFSSPLYHFADLHSLRTSYLLAAFACVLRPTNALVWVPVGISSLWRGNANQRQAIVREAAICGSVVALISIASDYLYYGSLTFPPLNFLYFNLSQDVAVFYGRNRRDYYVTEGLPLLLTTYTPFTITAVYRIVSARLDSGSPRPRRRERNSTPFPILAATSVFTVLALSLISHKEVRFIYPILPALHVLTAAEVHRFIQPWTSLRRNILALLLLVNVAIAFYTSQFHQRGVVDVTHFIRQEHEQLVESSALERTTVGFLMPCHSTPWRSHLVHSGIEAWALTCEPPLHVPLARRDSYLDEADRFYLEPKGWIGANMAAPNERAEGKSDKRPWPQYVAFFEQLEPTVQEVLKDTGYTECWRGFNTHFHDDWRRQGDVIVWCSRQ